MYSIENVEEKLVSQHNIDLIESYLKANPNRMKYIFHLFMSLNDFEYLFHFLQKFASQVLEKNVGVISRKFLNTEEFKKNAYFRSFIVRNLLRLLLEHHVSDIPLIDFVKSFASTESTYELCDCIEILLEHHASNIPFTQLKESILSQKNSGTTYQFMRLLLRYEIIEIPFDELISSISSDRDLLKWTESVLKQELNVIPILPILASKIAESNDGKDIVQFTEILLEHNIKGIPIQLFTRRLEELKNPCDIFDFTKILLECNIKEIPIQSFIRKIVESKNISVMISFTDLLLNYKIKDIPFQKLIVSLSDIKNSCCIGEEIIRFTQVLLEHNIKKDSLYQQLAKQISILAHKPRTGGELEKIYNGRNAITFTSLLLEHKVTKIPLKELVDGFFELTSGETIIEFTKLLLDNNKKELLLDYHNEKLKIENHLENIPIQKLAKRLTIAGNAKDIVEFTKLLLKYGITEIPYQIFMEKLMLDVSDSTYVSDFVILIHSLPNAPLELLTKKMIAFASTTSLCKYMLKTQDILSDNLLLKLVKALLVKKDINCIFQIAYEMKRVPIQTLVEGLLQFDKAQDIYSFMIQFPNQPRYLLTRIYQRLQEIGDPTYVQLFSIQILKQSNVDLIYDILNANSDLILRYIKIALNDPNRNSEIKKLVSKLMERKEYEKLYQVYRLLSYNPIYFEMVEQISMYLGSKKMEMDINQINRDEYIRNFICEFLQTQSVSVPLLQKLIPCIFKEGLVSFIEKIKLYLDLKQVHSALLLILNYMLQSHEYQKELRIYIDVLMDPTNLDPNLDKEYQKVK